jgi:hypothetical protein
MIQTIFLLVVLYIVYKLYTESHILYARLLLWINENFSSALLIGGIIFVYIYNYHQDMLYQVTSVLYDTSISKISRGGGNIGNLSSNTKTTKRSVSGLLKKKVGANQSWKCNRCSQMLDETYEVNHIIPLEEGGSNADTNLEALCRRCHGKISIANIIEKHS